VRGEKGMPRRDHELQLAHEVELQEQFDVATMRAVANLQKSIETGLPFVRAGGSLIVARGRSSRADIETAWSVGGLLGAGEVVTHSGAEGKATIRGSIIVFTKTDGAGS